MEKVQSMNSEDPRLKSTTRFLSVQVFVLAFLFFCKPRARAEIYEWQIEAGQEENYQEAQFRLWQPTNAKSLSGILVVILGDNMCGLHLANDPGWQALAVELRCGLLALNFTATRDRKSWSDVDGGTGKALEDGITKLAEGCGRPELVSSKLFLVGVSAGGQFAYHFALWKPDRVAAFVTMKGGYHRLPLPEDSLTVPGLIIMGSDDEDFRKANLSKIHQMGIERKAPWTLIAEEGSAHKCENASKMVIPYLEAINLGKNGLWEQNRNGERNWWPTADFRGRAQSFSVSSESFSGKKLSLASEKLPSRTVAAGKIEWDGIPWNKGSEWETIEFISGEQLPDWTSCEVKVSHGLVELDSSQFAFGSKKLRYRVKPMNRQILGVLHEEILFTFSKNGKKLLGSQRVPVTARIVGDLKLSPGYKIISGLVPDQFKVNIQSPTGKSFRFSKVEISPKTPGANIEVVGKRVSNDEIAIELRHSRKLPEILILNFIFESDEPIEIEFPIYVIQKSGEPMD